MVLDEHCRRRGGRSTEAAGLVGSSAEPPGSVNRDEDKQKGGGGVGGSGVRGAAPVASAHAQLWRPAAGACGMEAGDICEESL